MISSTTCARIKRFAYLITPPATPQSADAAEKSSDLIYGNRIITLFSTTAHFFSVIMIATRAALRTASHASRRTFTSTTACRNDDIIGIDLGTTNSCVAVMEVRGAA